MAGLPDLPNLLGITGVPLRCILALHDSILNHGTTKELQSVSREIAELQNVLESLPESLGQDEVTKAAMTGMGLGNSINRCGEYCDGFNDNLKKWLSRPVGLREVALHSHSMAIKRTEGEIAITKFTAMFSKEIAEFCKQSRTGLAAQEKTALVQEKRMHIQTMGEQIETHFVGRDPDFTREQRKALSQRAQMQIETLAGQGSDI